MPSASANMSAKFIAQIEISKPCVSSASSPAEASRPRIVSSSGSPAATSEPKASTRIASVTGQEKSSDFIIAVRLAVLKSDHIPEAPVRLTEIAARRERVQLALQRVGGGDHRRRVAFARRRRRAPCGRRARSRRPARGGTTVEMRGSARRIASDLRDRRAERGRARSSASASGRRRSAPSWRGRRSSAGSASRACTDSEPFACQPAPESAVSTFGANTASPSATTAQAIATAPDVVGGPAAEPADRADGLRVLDRRRTRRVLQRQPLRHPPSALQSPAIHYYTTTQFARV